MPRLFVVALTCALMLLCQHASAALIYDGFDYTAGNALVGQTNPGSGGNWIQTGNNTTTPSILAGSLSYPGLPASIGNSALTAGFGQTGNAGATKIALPSAIGTGTLYYSYIMKVTDVTGYATATTGGITTSGSFFAGFNNNTNTGSSVATAGAATMIHRDPSDPTKYQLGVGVATANALRVFDTANSYGVGDTLYVIGSYTFNPSTDDDVAKLYVFLDPAAIPAAEPGTANAVSSGTGSDIALNQLFSFFIRNNAVEPDHIQIDELRVDGSWAGVTGVPEPSSLALTGLLTIAALRRRRK